MKNLYKSSISLMYILCLTNLSGEQEGIENTDYLSPFNVIGSKEDVPVLEGTGSVLETTDLNAFFHTDVNDILKEVPGVYLRGEEGYGLFPNISLRGVDSHRSAKVTILEDGIPSSPSPFSDPAAYYSPTAGRMSGFEILKGSSQMKYGPNTTGGIINYISTPIPENQKSHLRASYGEYNERVAHAFSGGKTELGPGKLGYLVEIFDHRTDGFKTINSLGNAVGGEAPISKNDITLKLGYEFGEGDYIEFKAGRTDLDADVSYIGLSSEDFAANPYQRYHNTKLDNMDSEQTRYYLRYLKEIDEDTTFKATVFHNEFDRDWYKIGKVGVENNSTNSIEWKSIGKGAFASTNHINMLRGLGDMNDTSSYSGQGQVKYKHNDRNYKNTGIQASISKQWENHTFELGGRYTKDHYTYKDYTEDIYNVSNAGDSSASLSYDSSTSSSKGTAKDRISRAWETYLTDEILLDRLTLSPGIRYTSVEYQYKGAKRSVYDLLAGLGGTYDLGEHLAFAGVHQGHALPGYSAVTSNLEEEKSLGFEIGSRGLLSTVNYELAYFNTKIKEMIAVPSLASGLGDEASNIGEATIDGIELMLSKDLASNSSFSVPLSISSTFTNAEFDTATKPDAEDRYAGGSSGNKIPYVPEVQYNIRLGLVYENWSSYLNYHWQDEVYIDAANSSIIDDYGTLDWSGFYDMKPGVTLFAKVTNLADEKYAVSDMPDGLRPGAPRVASLGMEFNF
jgi:Fe(3+) dicitrate transport protein